MAAASPDKALLPLLALLGGCACLVTGIWSTFSGDTSLVRESHVAVGLAENAEVQADAAAASSVPSAEPSVAVSFDDLRFEAIRSRNKPIVKEGEIPARIQELSGREVQLTGYILPDAVEYMENFVLFSQENITRDKYPFPPDEVVRVEVAKGDRVQFAIQPFIVRGTLQIEPIHDPNGRLWFVYKLADAKAVRLGDDK
jgi:hypothetical protein